MTGKPTPYIVEMPDEPQASDEPQTSDEPQVSDEPQASDEPDDVVDGRPPTFPDENDNLLSVGSSHVDPEMTDSFDDVDGGPIDRCQDQNKNQFQGASSSNTHSEVCII